MLKGFLGLHIFKHLHCVIQERASRGGKGDSFNRIAHFSCKALKYGGVFRIDRDDPASRFLDKLLYYFTRDNKGFLVCKGNPLARLYGRNGRSKPGIAYHGCNNQIDIGSSYNLFNSFISGINLDRVVPQGFP